MKKNPYIVIIGATHGHEYLGVRVIEQLKLLKISSHILYMDIGNPRAYADSVAYIESDLNRVFPGDLNGDYEERRAYELSEKIKNADIVIDIHSTNTITSQNDAMLIVTKWDDKTQGIVHKICPPKVLVMSYMSDRALISNAKIGLAFEYGANDDDSALRAILHGIGVVFEVYGVCDRNPYSAIWSVKKTDVYEVYDVCMSPCSSCRCVEGVKNFHSIQEGEVIAQCDNHVVRADESFVPILFGKNRYADIFGFKGRVI